MMFNKQHQLRNSLIASVLFLTLSISFAQTISAPELQIDDAWTATVIDEWNGREKSVCKYTVLGKLTAFTRLKSDCFYQLIPNTKKINVAGLPNSYEFTGADDLNVIHRVGNQTYKRVNFDWPLSVGKKWTHSYKFTSGSSEVASPSGVTTYALSAEVTGWENVTVPVGTFKALKVVHEGTWSSSIDNATTSRLGFTYWYVPELKTWVKYKYESDSTTGMPSARDTTVLSNINIKH